jgi:hypothetical protein
MNWKNLLTATIAGTIVGTIESFVIVSLLAILSGFEVTRFEYTFTQFSASLYLGLICAAPPGAVAGFMGGLIGGFTALKPDTGLRSALIRGVIGGLILGVPAGIVGNYLTALLQ